MRSIHPVFRYPDASAAIEQLCAAFGFDVRRRYDGADGAVAHAVLGLDDHTVMVGSGRDSRGRPADDDYAVYVAVDDVDAHHERARAAGAQIVRAPFDTDYGSRDYVARDLAGNVWSFGTYRP
ncbi:VOC family protein [Micromonospora sp. NPDC050686]|uniref:VOC family protein n=1 Tax=Micromonospora sp. NPDC050686 TaxID=3154631 RepID=UPI0033CB463B